ncbi:MAG: outer membrane lipoprotein carrier protein LolA [Deltaproteobacteria bacterium]|nr:outer membrane lipoprotein carrier protein LolA [Deltaproteobacteria bacterium]
MTRSNKLARDLVLGLLALGAPAWIATDVITPSVVVAQDTPPPAAITPELVAARVQAFYDQTRTMEARFQQHFWIRAHGTTRSSRGTVVIQRPGRIRFDYSQPRGQVIASTPAGYTYYEPGDDGAPGQYARGSVEGASSALGFLTGTTNMARDYRFALRAVGPGAPEHTDALELRPRRADPHYRRIVLYVSNEASSLGVVRRVSIEDPDGNWNRFDFSDPQFNREVSASTFEYQPPSGAREMTMPAAGGAPAAPARGATGAPAGASTAAPGTGTGASGLPAPGR